MESSSLISSLLCSVMLVSLFISIGVGWGYRPSRRSPFLLACQVSVLGQKPLISVLQEPDDIRFGVPPVLQDNKALGVFGIVGDYQ